MMFLLAQQPAPWEFAPAEIVFFKMFGLAVMLLWPIYLVKEIWFSRHSDPRVDALVSSMGAMATAIATTTTKMEAMERRQGELIKEQRDDTKELTEMIRSFQHGVETVIRDHEGDIQRLTAHLPK